MRPISPLSLFLSCVVPLWADPFAELVRPTEPLTAAEQARNFKLPPGFEIQLLASEPVINKPMNMAFDDAGRLWVTSSAEYPWAIKQEQWKTPEGHLNASKDKIVVFSDSDGDGIVDKPSIFADNLNIPTGVLPYGQGCIAWSIPNIWYLADTDGDGICDQRKILFGPLGWEKDTHGNLSSFRLRPDGWVYATHGFSNVTHIAVREEHGGIPKDKRTKPTPSAENWPLGEANLDFGNSLDLQSGNVFRFRPDGSRVEPWSWGQVNPYGMTFDRYGNLYTADCHSNPLTQVIRGAYYPSFGKPHDGLGFGPVLCEHSHGSTGICGPLYLHSGVWGPEYDEQLLVCNPVTSRINRDAVQFTGATPKAHELKDFLSTEDPWFRPVDIQLGPDGALYVADFYNRIIGHYEVPLTHPGRDRERGRLWRISKNGVPKAPHTELQSVQLATEHFGHAQGEIQCRGLVASDLQSGRPDSLEKLLVALAKCPAEDPSQRHFLKIGIRDLLRLPGAFDVVGKFEDKAKIEPILGEIMRTLRTPEAAAWVLAQLDQNPGDKALLKQSLAPLARNLGAADEAKLAQLVQSQFPTDLGTQVELFQALRSGIAQRGTPTAATTAWGSQLVKQMLDGLEKGEPLDWQAEGENYWAVETRACEDGQETPVLTSLPSPRGGEVERKTGSLRSRQFSCPAKLRFWLCGHVGNPEEPAHEKSYIRLIDASGAELQRAYPPRKDTAQPISWELKSHEGKSVRIEITDGDAADAYAWLAAGRFRPAVVPLELGGASALQSVAELARDLKLAAEAPRLAKHFAREGLTDKTRSAIAQALGSFPGQEAVLAELLAKSPGRYHAMLAENLAGSLPGAQKLLSGPNPRLLTLPTVSKKIAALKDAELNKQIAAKTAQLPPVSTAAAQKVKERLVSYQNSGGDAKAGLQVFTTHCALCHKVGQTGQVVGPQLEGAGNRGLERLCEDILDPNRDVDPAFHLRILTLKDGSVQSGLQRRTEGETLILADATGRESTLNSANIAKTETVPMSIMPPTFAETISEADFRNLLAWLLSLSQ